MDPVGVHSFWGFSPALDLQQLYRTAFGAASWDDAAPLNILLVQPGDPRSVIKTIAQRFRHSPRPLHVRGSAARARAAAPSVSRAAPRGPLTAPLPLPPAPPTVLCL